MANSNDPPPPYEHPADATIAIMGSTGTGKSSFIQLVTGDNSITVGHGLQSETSIINCAEYFNPEGRKVTLIDTPGFDDSREDITDVDILRMIGEYLTREFHQGKKLSGVIYTYNIANTRIGGVSRRNLKMFQKLVGSNSLKNVVIMTTMWGSVEQDVGEMREKELKSNDNLFKPLIGAGARIMRHDRSVESANNIIDTILGNTPQALLIQTELDSGAKLVETSAGAQLSEDLDHFVARDGKRLQELEEELKEAVEDGDQALEAELQKGIEKLKRRMKSREEDKAKLATNIYSFGPAMGARIAYRATGMRRVGGAIGAVGGAAGLGFLAAGRGLEKCVGVPKEKSIKTQVPSLVEVAERHTYRFADAGKKHFGKPGAIAGGALGATIGVTAGVLKGLGHIVENM